MIDRDRAIRILEAYDDTWDYEDMDDIELINRVAQTIDCSSAKQEKIGCKDTTCIECWRAALSCGGQRCSTKKIGCKN